MIIGSFVFPAPVGAGTPFIAPIGNLSGLGCYSIGAEPRETRCVTVNCDFSVSGAVEIILTELIQSGKIDKVQTLYVDNKDGSADIDFITDIIGQRITIPAGWQGFLPVFVGSNVNRILAYSVGNDKVLVQMLNIFVPTNMWDANVGA